MSLRLMRYSICIVACLTLGLAPLPEPHLWQKLRWIASGGNGMRPIDWFDVVLHGAPWVVLIVMLARDAVLPRKRGEK